jgi:hypothetical protein
VRGVEDGEEVEVRIPNKIGRGRRREEGGARRKIELKGV